jgi:hypothetical protein
MLLIGWTTLAGLTPSAIGIRSEERHREMARLGAVEPCGCPLVPVALVCRNGYVDPLREETVQAEWQSRHRGMWSPSGTYIS